MRWVLSFAAAALLLQSSVARALPPLGSGLQDRRLQPVDGDPLMLSSGLGRPTLIFYESKASHSQNWPFKKKLKDLVHETNSYRERVALFPIVDLEGYDFWPVHGFAADAVRAEAKRIGYPIYCDWNGDLKKAFDVQGDLSTVILIDRAGKVIFASEGPLSEDEQTHLLDLLRVELQVASD
jgi:hypothetical protein